MTRAQALLIIVGDPTVLSLDPVWRSFLNYVHLSGGWTGKKIDWNPHEDERGESFLKQREEMAKSQMQELMERLNLGDESEEDGEVAHDRPWREEE
jgi:helicase MOV-10